MLQSLQFSAVAAGLDPLIQGCRSIFQRVFVPKSFYSERFLFWSVIMSESFIPKGRYSEIRNNDPSELKSSEWCFDRDKNLQNNDLSK